MSPQHRRRRSMVVGVALAILAASASASAQDFLDHVNADANRNAGSSGVRAASVLDVDRLVATAVDRGVLLQRARPGQRGNSNANTMRWAGIAMLGAGGLLAVNGALATCGTIDSSGYRETGMCGGRVVVGGGVAAVGAWLMTR